MTFSGSAANQLPSTTFAPPAGDNTVAGITWTDSQGTVLLAFPGNQGSEVGLLSITLASGQAFMSSTFPVPGASLSGNILSLVNVTLTDGANELILNGTLPYGQ